MYTEEEVLRLIHDGASKCILNINLCQNEKHIDGVIGMCNCLSSTVVSILNHEDFPFFGPRLNMHRRWCKRAFSTLQITVAELDARITLKKEELNTQSDARIGF